MHVNNKLKKPQNLQHSLYNPHKESEYNNNIKTYEKVQGKGNTGPVMSCYPRNA